MQINARGHRARRGGDSSGKPTGNRPGSSDGAFPRTDTSDFVGSVRCTAPGEGMFTGVAVELDAVNRIFTTLPVVPVPERMSQE